MIESKTSQWINKCLINLFIVAALGVLMRYKIAFEFPFFSQKNLQHAHSHFAFNGWVSLILMILLVDTIKNRITETSLKSFNILFTISLIVSYGMLISFTMQGYGIYSIVLSTLAIFISFWFAWHFFTILREIKDIPGRDWMLAAIFFSVLSSLGTFWLSVMMASKNLDQHAYLASLYWYLHFQYNGWFFLACVGLFINYLHLNGINISNEKQIFYLFAISCVPTYGLSILWLNLPNWVYTLIILATIAQFYALILMFRQLIKLKLFNELKLDFVAKILMVCFATALTIKFSLQFGSLFPAISKFAFGFRHIVIAYLHLVLLAFTSVFLISYSYFKGYILPSSSAKLGIMLFVLGVFLNELLLATQGIASISYTMIPFVNESLFVISILISLGLVVLILANFKRQKTT